MADNNIPVKSIEWLEVIGKSLANICLREAQRDSPEKFKTILKQVKFLQGLGLSRKHAAEAAGSTDRSVGEMQSRRRERKRRRVAP